MWCSFTQGEDSLVCCLDQRLPENSVSGSLQSIFSNSVSDAGHSVNKRLPEKTRIYFSGSLYLAYAQSRLGLNFAAVHPVLDRARIVYAGGGRGGIEQHDNQRLALYIGI